MPIFRSPESYRAGDQVKPLTRVPCHRWRCTDGFVSDRLTAIDHQIELNRMGATNMQQESSEMANESYESQESHQQYNKREDVVETVTVETKLVPVPQPPGLTDHQRYTAANLFLQTVQDSRQQMSIEQADQIAQSIRAGRADHIVQQQLDKQRAGQVTPVQSSHAPPISQSTQVPTTLSQQRSLQQPQHQLQSYQYQGTPASYPTAQYSTHSPTQASNVRLQIATAQQQVSQAPAPYPQATQYTGQQTSSQQQMSQLPMSPYNAAYAAQQTSNQQASQPTSSLYTGPVGQQMSPQAYYMTQSSVTLMGSNAQPATMMPTHNNIQGFQQQLPSFPQQAHQQPLPAQPAHPQLQSLPAAYNQSQAPLQLTEALHSAMSLATFSNMPQQQTQAVARRGPSANVQASSSTGTAPAKAAAKEKKKKSKK